MSATGQGMADTRDVDLRPNQGFSLTLGNGCVIKALVVKLNGRLRLRVYDAGTGQPIQRFKFGKNGEIISANYRKP